jgi:hypothetical protein
MLLSEAQQHAATLWPDGGVYLGEARQVELVRIDGGVEARLVVCCWVARKEGAGLRMLTQAARWSAIDWRAAVDATR